MIIVIAGPTCSGKSSLALKIAKKFNGEIVNGDAFQVYKYFNIGTAKPTLEERKEVQHHLFDFIEPSKNYSVKDYQEDVRKIIIEIQKANKNIIIVGGTGLYQKAALFDYSFVNENKRVDLSDLDNLSNYELYEYLKNIDEKSATKIHFNNRKRVLRAIEIFRQHGKTKSSIENAQDHKLLYDVLFVGLNIARDKLYVDIDKRVDKMFENGLLEEVEFLKNKFPRSCHAFQAIGYKELLDYFDKNISLEDAKNLIKQHSRNYAKRQMTFFKNQLPIIWFDTKEEAFNYVMKEIG